MSEPRQYTAEEIRDMLIEHIWELIEYWEKEERRETSRSKLEGLAFSILSMLDGATLELPAFALIADPHSEDKDYHIECGENWFPENDLKQINEPICFMLHEDFYREDLRKDK